MDLMIPILAAVVGIAVIIFLVITVFSRPSRGKGTRSKGREATLKKASKRLEQNPRDPQALSELGDLYYREEDWDQAYRTYGLLAEIGGQVGGQSIDEFETNLRWGMSALKLGLTDEAYKGLHAARNINPNHFEVAHNLGVLEFQRKNYEKSIQLLNQARVQDPDSAPNLRTLGHAYFRVKKNKEAMTHIRKAIELAPDDRESLYTLAECYYEAGQTEQALRVFNHLRGDPAMGADACLTCGIIHTEGRQYEKAINDFELGLRHENIKADVRTELSYRLATSYLKENDIAKAITLLRGIQAENPTYKDVAVLIGK